MVGRTSEALSGGSRAKHDFVVSRSICCRRRHAGTDAIERMLQAENRRAVWAALR